MICFSNGCSGFVEGNACGSVLLLRRGYGERRIGKIGIKDIALWPTMGSQR